MVHAIVYEENDFRLRRVSVHGIFKVLLNYKNWQQKYWNKSITSLANEFYRFSERDQLDLRAEAMMGFQSSTLTEIIMRTRLLHRSTGYCSVKIILFFQSAKFRIGNPGIKAIRMFWKPNLRKYGFYKGLWRCFLERRCSNKRIGIACIHERSIHIRSLSENFRFRLASQLVDRISDVEPAVRDGDRKFSCCF